MDKTRHIILSFTGFICLALYIIPFKGHAFSVERDLDIHYLVLDLMVYDTSTAISGSSEIHISNHIGGLSHLVLDMGSNLQVDSVFIDQWQVKYTHRADSLIIGISDLKNDSNILLKIHYHGNGDAPKRFGVNTAFLSQWDQNVTWTLSEPFYSKYWFPIKQDLTDKIDSATIILTTTKGLKAVSNGILVNEETLPGNKVRFTWKTRYPMAYYLVSFAVSNYAAYHKDLVIDGKNLKFENYLYRHPSYLEQNSEHIDSTVYLLQVFSGLFGTYPFIEEKYGHATAPMGGGMEHQTLTTIANFDFELVAHELAHQWWGNLVTCETWKDIWINEGFATYSEYLAYEFMDMPDQATEWLQKTRTRVLSENNGSVYISDYPDSVERIFDQRLSYDKGALVIHMLRNRMDNDTIFFSLLRSFLGKHAFSTANTEGLKVLLEDLTLKDWDIFFNSWIYGEGFPVVNLAWEQVSESELVIHASLDRPYPIEMNLMMDYFTGHNTSFVYKINGWKQTDTLQISGMVKNLAVQSNESELYVIESLVRIPNRFFGNEVLVRYDPDNEYWTLYKHIDHNVKVQIINMQGQLVYESDFSNDMITISAQSLPPGIYIFDFRIMGGYRYSKKIYKY
jgi:aminopeptidase N